MADKFEVIEKTTPFQGYFRVDRYTLRHQRHDGGWTAPMTREIFERGHASGVLLYDPVRDEVGLIEQFRPGAMAAGWQPWMIEIVAGIIDDGATSEEVAIREAEEEAGAIIKDLVPICKYLVTPGGSTESMALYCARIDSRSLGGFHGLEEEGEDIRVFSVAAEEAIGWVESGRVINSCAIIALQWLALNRQRLISLWTT
ncbi:NUDIX domain-containing protein [Telmatospirillum siberiense]|uniref:ADP-ribose pyrophosphatase n=1 Tax=Telmatospirillum siberiense TaxID=382514 RepID=A0A2N3PZM1_9PROT|nr:NUDIX domain-containing protein [Telmatospirillum siberiense]PKU25860.1 ADP-ribose diphosphatase [Telmatospirillum siberiense]